MTIGFIVALALIAVGVILGKVCGFIKQVPKSVCLIFTLIFLYAVALNASASDANSILIANLPFIKQFGIFNGISQNIGIIVDSADLFLSLRNFTLSVEFWDNVIRLWILNFFICILHNLFFAKNIKNIFTDLLFWYLKEALMVAIVILLIQGLSKLIGAIIPQETVDVILRISIILLTIFIVFSAALTLFKSKNRLGSAIINFFTNNFFGKNIVLTTISVGVSVLLVYGIIIFGSNIPREFFAVTTMIPLAILFFLVWFMVYRLVWKKD